MTHERSVTTTFFFLQDINLSLEVIVRLNLSGVSEHHTTLDFILIYTTEEETYVITSFTLIEKLAEHFHTRNNSLLTFCTETDHLNFVIHVNNTSFDTTCSYSTTTCNREHVFYRHKEWFIHITRRQRNPSIYSFHKFHNLSNPRRISIESTKSRTTDDRSIIAIVVIETEKLTHIHFYEFKHFLVFNEVTLVQEHNDTRNVYLTSKKHMLTSLGHRTISSSNYDDSTVHLSSTRYHVLNVVGVTRAVYVCIVTISCFVLNV